MFAAHSLLLALSLKHSDVAVIQEHKGGAVGRPRISFPTLIPSYNLRWKSIGPRSFYFATGVGNCPILGILDITL